MPAQDIVKGRPSTILRLWKRFYRLNHYYHKDLQSLAAYLIPKDASVIEFGSKGGELLSSLLNKSKSGVVLHKELLDYAKTKMSGTRIISIDDFPEKFRGKKFDYVLLSHALSEVEDVQDFLRKIRAICHDNTRIVVVYFNFLWKPFLNIAEKLGLRLPQLKEPNWLSERDVDNFFYLEDFEKIKSGKRFLIPYKIPLFSDFVNKFLARLPLINAFCLTNYSVFKPKPATRKTYSVSIIIPARNEAGNMQGVLERIPKLGKETEVVFIEGHSQDNTYEVIKKEIEKNKRSISARLLKQKGKGKGDAVRLGFSKAKNEVLMILDADLTVGIEELRKFYKAVALSKGDLIIGSRLVYPMEKQAMRILNLLGNKSFSWVFTFLLGQKIKDTLCGTKVLLKENYKKIEKNRKIFGDFDPFGDFDLIFGATYLNLKIVEIPIRYKERVYGKTNISRFKHGFLLLKMALFAAKKIKFV